MKKLFNVIAAVAMGTLLLFSCEEPNSGVNGGNEWGKVEIKVPQGVVVPDAIMRPDLITPVNYTPDFVEGGEDGVGIRITAKEPANFKFEVRPGMNIQSYRLDVYPLCRLYNSLYETARSEGRDLSQPLSQSVVESMIRGFIFDSQGAGAYTFSASSLDDYLCHEFDWMNTPYAQAKVVPDCEYIIAVVGCFDTEGSEQGDMTLCYVRTPYFALIGNPEVNITVDAGYTKGNLRYSAANDDVKYYYQWCSDESDLQPYIDAYGDKLYIDFMRNAIYTATDIDAPVENGIDPHVFTINFGMTASPDHTYMATAIGLDENFTPAPKFQKLLFHPKERPEDTKPAEAVITVPENRVGASLFWVDCYMPEDCPNVYMEVLHADQAQAIMQYDEQQMAYYALVLQTQEGDGRGYWGFTNWNYPEGNSCTVRDIIQFGSPDTEYYIAYTATNSYMELAPVQFVGPFRTKPLITNTPEASVADVVLTLSSSAPTKVDLDFTYDIEKTAAVHFQYIEGFGEKTTDSEGNTIYVEKDFDGNIMFTYPTQNSSREELLDYIYYDMYTNRWASEEGGHMHWTDILTPDTKYTIAYVGEDWNGVFGEVKFASVVTGQLAGGNNPVAEILGKVDEKTGDPYFLIQHVQDCWGVYYLSGDASVNALMLENLGDKKLSFRNADKALEAWYNYCMEYKVNGDATLGNPIRIDISTEKEVAICIPLGGTPDNVILGDMVYLIYDNGGWYDLSHYYPTTVSAPMARRVINRGERPEMPKVEVKGVRKPIVGSSQVIEVDYDKFSSHPKAKAW